MSKHKDIQAVIELLAEQYPKCFSVYEQRRKPLKVGIHNDIPKYLRFTTKAFSAALQFYCWNSHYLSACREGVTRIDLNGEPCGVVTAEEAVGAKERLGRLQDKYKRRQQAKEIAERKAKNKGRLSLADLRKAAKARRAA